jgi:hypothetical protein
MRRPERMVLVLVRIGASGADLNMSIVSRVQIRSGSSASTCSTARAARPPDIRPCRTGPHGLAASCVGITASPSA